MGRKTRRHGAGVISDYLLKPKKKYSLIEQLQQSALTFQKEVFDALDEQSAKLKYDDEKNRDEAARIESAQQELEELRQKSEEVVTIMFDTFDVPKLQPTEKPVATNAVDPVQAQLPAPLVGQQVGPDIQKVGTEVEHSTEIEVEPENPARNVQAENVEPANVEHAKPDNEVERQNLIEQLKAKAIALSKGLPMDAAANAEINTMTIDELKQHIKDMEESTEGSTEREGGKYTRRKHRNAMKYTQRV